jgi:hypothetical protein
VGDLLEDVPKGNCVGAVIVGEPIEGIFGDSPSRDVDDAVAIKEKNMRNLSRFMETTS